MRNVIYELSNYVPVLDAAGIISVDSCSYIYVYHDETISSIVSMRIIAHAVIEGLYNQHVHSMAVCVRRQEVK